jgi:hypothetical protein
VAQAFERAVRALAAVGDSFVVVSRESARTDPAEFERRVASPLRGLIERAQASGEVRDDLPASWLMETLIGIIVSSMQSQPSLGVDDTVAGITSLFLDGPGSGTVRRPPGRFPGRTGAIARAEKE